MIIHPFVEIIDDHGVRVRDMPLKIGPFTFGGGGGCVTQEWMSEV